MTQREYYLLSRMLDSACQDFLKQSETYRSLRKAQAVVQEKRQQLWIANHRRKQELKLKEKAA